jgi:hypothetical protein
MVILTDPLTKTGETKINLILKFFDWLPDLVFVNQLYFIKTIFNFEYAQKTPQSYSHRAPDRPDPVPAIILIGTLKVSIFPAVGVITIPRVNTDHRI